MGLGGSGCSARLFFDGARPCGCECGQNGVVHRGIGVEAVPLKKGPHLSAECPLVIY